MPILTEAQGLRQRLLRSLPAVLVVAAIVFAIRCAYVLHYGSPVPFFDQWDAEGGRLLKPLIDGTLGLQDWFAAHNEHRIFWSRLVSVGVFAATGEWNNQSLAIASASVAAMVSAVLAAIVWLGLGSMVARLSMLALVLVLGASPFSWENILVGFQSQFYFMTLFGVLGVLCASLLRGIPGYAGTTLFAVASVFSMASGLIGVVAAGATRAFAMLAKREVQWLGVSMVALMAAIALAALRAVPEIPPHHVLRAQDVGQFIEALGVALSWPFVGMPLMALPIWAPFAVASLLGLAGRRLGRFDIACWGIALMAFGQAMAMAYSRGADMVQVPSRYTDLLALGLFANAFLAFRIVESTDFFARWRRGQQGLAVAATAALIAAFGIRGANDLGAMADRAALTCTHRAMLRNFLHTDDPAQFVGPPSALPYPNRDRLVELIRDPALNRLLQPYAEPAAAGRCLHASGDAVLPWLGLDMAIIVPYGALAPGGRPRPLQPEQPATLVATAPMDGALLGVAVLVGTYGGLADGRLSIEACTGGRCVRGGVDIGAVPDNTMARVRLDAPLVVRRGDHIDLWLLTEGATQPLALWTYPQRDFGFAFKPRDDASDLRAVGELAFAP